MSFWLLSMAEAEIAILTHWGRNQITALMQTTFSNAFSWMKMYEFRFKFHWFVPKGLIKNIAALVPIMAWAQPGNNLLSEPMMVRLLTHIYVILMKFPSLAAPEVVNNDDFQCSQRRKFHQNEKQVHFSEQDMLSVGFIFWKTTTQSHCHNSHNHDNNSHGHNGRCRRSSQHMWILITSYLSSLFPIPFSIVYSLSHNESSNQQQHMLTLKTS